MKRVFLASMALGTILTLCGSAMATTIADYTTDFQSSTPATGWTYMCNSQGAIGDPSNYSALAWNSNQSVYTQGGADYPTAAGYLWMEKWSVQPGYGAADDPSGVGRYAIAAYTIQAGEAGQVSITNSAVKTWNGYNADANAYGVTLSVYVNNSSTPINTITGIFDTAQSFDWTLGTLKEGDVVYVAVGPTGPTSYATATNLSFTLSSIPEPSTILMMLSGAISVLLYGWRRHRCD